MVRVTIGSELRNQIVTAADGEVVELADEAGVVVARCTPVYDPTRYEIVGEWASEDEIRRRIRDDPTYTAEQVINRLRSLRK
jgi:hypothetical protein